jgi:hypothetical protein
MCVTCFEEAIPYVIAQAVAVVGFRFSCCVANSPSVRSHHIISPIPSSIKHNRNTEAEAVHFQAVSIIFTQYFQEAKSLQ